MQAGSSFLRPVTVESAKERIAPLIRNYRTPSGPQPLQQPPVRCPAPAVLVLRPLRVVLGPCLVLPPGVLLRPLRPIRPPVRRRMRSARRLASVGGHFAAATQPGAAPAPLGLLSEAQLAEFMDSGCLVLPVTDLPAATHASINAKCKAVDAENPGNDILAAVPELAEVFSSPVVAGALTSVLGASYCMHRHRHLHSSGETDQVYHKDSHWGINRMRHHRSRLCMVLYYPSDVASECDGPNGGDSRGPVLGDAAGPRRHGTAV
jgi:hypothetical protein